MTSYRKAPDTVALNQTRSLGWATEGPNRGRATRAPKAGLNLLIFALASLISALSPLLIIPAVIAGWGVGGWASVAVGQSVGAIGSVVVMWGWALQGPVTAARAETKARLAVLLLESMSSRVPIAILVVPIAAVVASGLAPDQKLVAGLTAAGFSLAGLSMVWYFVGVRRPALVLLYDSIPRLLIAAIGAIGIASTGWLIFYPITLIVGTLAYNILSFMDISGSYSLPLGSLKTSRIRRGLLGSAGAGVSQLSSAVYINGAVALVAIWSSEESIAEFGAVNRLYLAATVASVPVFQLFAGWVAKERSVVGPRARLALTVQLALALIAVPGFILLAPFIARVVFSEAIPIGEGAISLAACGVALVIFTRALGSHVLMANNQSRAVGASAGLGAVIGVFLIPSLSIGYGAVGACGAILIVESAVLFVQSVVAFRLIRADRKGKD